MVTTVRIKHIRMQKVLYIIPGYTESRNDEPYQRIATVCKGKGYTVHIVSITWKYRTMSDYILEARSQICGEYSSVSILGFSFGAFIAAALATKSTVQALYLCSLSPYFSEILPMIPAKWTKALGVKRTKDFQKFSLIKIAEQTSANVHFFQGEKEISAWPSMIECAKIAQANYTNYMYHVVQNSGHDIRTEAYQLAIKNVI